MNSSNQRVQELFLAALELPKSERRNWLSEQCDGDEKLMADVLSLLDYDHRRDDPLEHSQHIIVGLG